ncbi:peptidoglycan-binding domain-containing protein [Paenibacillus peoriae]|uniref:peptidoglycan-binding domain-containing protein n=1 Tax=Paenibacillus peoriae TaxID=59893 RepID=UPI003F9AE579
MKRNLKSVMSLAVASVALVGSLGLASIASASYAYDGFNGFPTLRQGDSGGYVRALQANLWAYGQKGDVGRIDGSFGSGVKTGLQNFQRNKGLPADGTAGSGTWNRMTYNVSIEVPGRSFTLSSSDSSTYYVFYGRNDNNRGLRYSVLYKSNNKGITEGTVFYD